VRIERDVVVLDVRLGVALGVVAIDAEFHGSGLRLARDQ
jgi:hypothetical protein